MTTSTQPAWRSLYPFESHWLELEGARLHYLDEGPPADSRAAGETLLCVHGNPTWSFYWRRIATAFRQECRVIAPDHVGCGLSDKPQDYPYTLDRHIDNLLALIERLDLRDITLLAHDWGGAIGLGAATRQPQRFARIVLFNTGAFPPPFIPFRIRLCRVPLLGTLAVRGLNAFAKAALWMATARPENFTAEVKQGFLAPYDSWANRVAIDAFVKDIPAHGGHPTWKLLEKIERDLRLLDDKPAMFIWGMRDWCFTPMCLERLLESLPAAEVHRLEDASHYVVEDAHELIGPLLEQFLAKQPRAAQPREHVQ